MNAELMNIGQIPPSLLLAVRAENLDWKTALGELVDNSFDAYASRVEIDFPGKKQLVVKDDGRGCHDLAQMLTMGKHFGRNSGLGRYGIGLKNAACWLWGTLKIQSTHKGTTRQVMVNWETLAKQDDWLIASTLEQEARPGDIGTRLVFDNITKATPPFDHLSKELGYWFSPAIRSGKQIVIRKSRGIDIVVAPWQPPVLQSVVTDEFHINGKHVRLYAGIFPEGTKADRFGFHFTHRHRVIKEGCGLGAKGHSVTRICGIIDLDGSWMLTKNKTDIVDDCTELENAIWERCGEIIMQSEEQASEIFNSELQSQVTDALRNCLDNMLKGKRQKNKGKTGSQEPTGKGGKHRNAKNTQPGPGGISSRIDVGRLRMLFAPSTDGGIGRVDIAGNVVYLNQDHPRVMFHREAKNHDALVDMCLTLLSYSSVHVEQKQSLPFAREYSGFLEMLSSLLSGSSQPESVNA